MNEKRETKGKIYPGMIECSIKCPKCDGPVPLNGPWETAHCDRCQTDIDVPHDFWTDMFDDIIEDIKTDLAEGEGRNSTIFGTFNTTLLYGHLIPYCLECKTDLDMDKMDLALAKPYVHKCPNCGSETNVDPPPAWAKEEYAKARVFVNAIMESGDEGEAPTVSGPVAFTCPQCGGALMIDGTERLMPCKFCGVNVYLPDDLWFRLHPAKIKRRWFAVLVE
jgi:Zn finger protein HypA/HybF involved in hydrogenase expression